ncbi:MAG: site-specific integrase [Micrococcales bacterium]|nr:site-specific integrase [Micrococcales bacterium]
MNWLLQVLKDGKVPARRPWPIRDYAIITTLAVTGLRASELLELSVGDVEGLPGQRQIAVRHGKGDKYRAIPIDPRLETVLTAYLTDRWPRFVLPAVTILPTDDPWVQSPPNTPLWADGHGEPLTVGQLEYFVRKAYSTAGINSHRPPGALIHALRHTFATRLVENGVSAVEVMGLLGHASLQTTQRYIATRPDHLRSAVAANPAYGQL